MKWIPAQVPGIENIDKQFRFTVKASRGEVIQVENFVRILAFRVNFSFWEKYVIFVVNSGPQLVKTDRRKPRAWN